MRENRPSGSEVGGVETNRLPLPLFRRISKHPLTKIDGDTIFPRTIEAVNYCRKASRAISATDMPNDKQDVSPGDSIPIR